MIQKTSTCVLVFDYRSVFVVVVITTLEGERDYGEQTLATPTFQRSHVFRGVVNMVFVNVKMQCVKSVFLVKSRKVVYTIARTTFVHNKQVSYVILHCFLKARIALHKITSLALTEQ